jgi:hypothetical protein
VSLRWLLSDLFAPTGPMARLVAAWAFAGELDELQPVPGVGTGRLRRLLEQPVAAGWSAPAQPVWHCSVHNHPDDPVLPDAWWAQAAVEMMAAVGLAPSGDVDAVRWVAVRRGDRHLHLVATLVRQDGRTVWAWHDWLRVQATARALERRHGLVQVQVVGGPGRRATPIELHKAARCHPGVLPREVLHRQVRAVAAAAGDEAGFFAALLDARLLVRRRFDRAGAVVGYAVALPDPNNFGGEVWFGGSR